MSLLTSELNEQFFRCPECRSCWFERRSKKKLKKQTFTVLDTKDFYECIECGRILKEELE